DWNFTPEGTTAEYQFLHVRTARPLPTTGPDSRGRAGHGPGAGDPQRVRLREGHRGRRGMATPGGLPKPDAAGPGAASARPRCRGHPERPLEPAGEPETRSDGALL